MEGQPAPVDARNDLPLRFGVAGWSYPDWDDNVYAGGVRDKLEYLSRFVDTVEVNTTFYRPPLARQTEAWVRRTAGKPAFRFSAKLHQDVTHRGSLDPGLTRAVHTGLLPMVEAGRLTHLLAQFRYDFVDSPRNRDHLRGVREHFGDITEIVLELRHNSWQSPGALEFLGALGVTVANLDYPLSRTSFSLRECRIGTNGYFRLHGRNRAAWFDKGAGRDETYNYLYSRAELEEIQQRVLSLMGSFRSVTVIANNHFRGKQLANVLELKSRITRSKVAVPPGLLAAYPRLEEIADAQAADTRPTGIGDPSRDVGDAPDILQE